MSGLKCLFASLLVSSMVAACAGPGQGALGRTPIATTKAKPTEAPAASSSDAEREQLVQADQSMQDAQEAHREAGQESRVVAEPLPGQPTPPAAPVAPAP